jgi:hypothetical protein
MEPTLNQLHAFYTALAIFSGYAMAESRGFENILWHCFPLGPVVIFRLLATDAELGKSFYGTSPLLIPLPR